MKRTFLFTITTDYPDGEQAARDAAEHAVNRIGWGDDNTSSFELVEVHESGPPTYLAGWEFEPGDQSDAKIEDIERGKGVSDIKYRRGDLVVKVDEVSPGRWEAWSLFQCLAYGDTSGDVIRWLERQGYVAIEGESA